MCRAARPRRRTTAPTTRARRRCRCAPAWCAARPVGFGADFRCSAHQDSEPLRSGHRSLPGEEHGRAVRAVDKIHGVSGLSAPRDQHGLLPVAADLQPRLCALRRQHLPKELHALPRHARLSEVHLSVRELRGRLRALLLQHDLQEGLSALLGPSLPSAQPRLSQLHRRRPRRRPAERHEALPQRGYRAARDRLSQQRSSGKPPLL